MKKLSDEELKDLEESMGRGIYLTPKQAGGLFATLADRDEELKKAKDRIKELEDEQESINRGAKICSGKEGNYGM